MSLKNDCSQLLRISKELGANPPFGSSDAGACCASDFIKCDLNSKITELNLSGKSLKGNIPSSLFDFPNLRLISLASNPDIYGSLPDLSLLKMLNSIDVSNTGLSGELLTNFITPGLSSCTFDNTKLCLSDALSSYPCTGFQALPLCKPNPPSPSPSSSSEPSLPKKSTKIPSKITSTLIASSISSTIPDIIQSPSVTPEVIPESIPTFHSSLDSDNLNSFLGIDNVLWIIGASVFVVAALLISCLIWSHASRKNNPNNNLGSLLGYSSLNRGKIFKSINRNDTIPSINKRNESLEINRVVHELAAEKMAEYFISRNQGKKEFPVSRSYAKDKKDELNLSTGDQIVLYKVFNDTWAEGVSRRTGGPALFPVSCLGGPALSILCEPNLFSSAILIPESLNRTPKAEMSSKEYNPQNISKNESYNQIISAYQPPTFNHQNSNADYQNPTPPPRALNSQIETFDFSPATYNPFKSSIYLENDNENTSLFRDLQESEISADPF